MELKKLMWGKEKPNTNLSSYQCRIGALPTFAKVLISLVFPSGKQASSFAYSSAQSILLYDKVSNIYPE